MHRRYFGTVNPGRQIPWMRKAAQSCGICPQPGPGTAANAKLTRLGALGCITREPLSSLSKQVRPGSG